ncbi:DUF885 domain-containing protein [Actinomyces ruminicola]|uniref:DUF885 domain-containing protein n=1 Tax=Actinomyces ruminicola TaxID=332524 RepID=UPI0011C96D33|nr:DUF885 domain-containing protein [Actinomyces ruminicola]
MSVPVPPGYEPEHRGAGATGALGRLRGIADELARLSAAHDPRAAADTGILPPQERPLLPALGPDALAERARVARRLRDAARAVQLPQTPPGPVGGSSSPEGARGAGEEAASTDHSRGDVGGHGGPEGVPADPLGVATRARVLRAHLIDRLDATLGMIDSWEEAAQLGGLTSPLQRLRRELRPPALLDGDAAPGDADRSETDTPTRAGVGAEEPGRHAAWEEIAGRLEQLPTALAELTASLDAAAAHGVIAPRSQVLLAVGQARTLADPGEGAGSIGGLLAAADRAGRAAPSQALRRRLQEAAAPAAHACLDLAEHLRGELAAHADPHEGVGPQRHAHWVARMLGTRLDAAAAYAWASEELQEVIAAQDAIAVELLGAGARCADLDAHLRADRGAGLRPEEFVPWAQQVADSAGEALIGPVLAPSAALGRPAVALDAPGGGAHYEEPDPATGRPGTMLRSLAAGDELLWPWAERTTVLHETVPGHHTHSGAQAVDARLTDWQRHLARVPGCNEGWGLYAERLGVETGLIADPADRYGWLAARRWRLARVLIDLGVHARLPVSEAVAALPGASGGRRWDRPTVAAVLRAHTVLGEGFLQFEVDRQLGWPAQGLAYALGERVWLAGREAARRRAAAAGGDFDLRGFHDRGIALGSVGLDLLERELAR